MYTVPGTYKDGLNDYLVMYFSGDTKSTGRLKYIGIKELSGDLIYSVCRVGSIRYDGASLIKECSLEEFKNSYPEWFI